MKITIYILVAVATLLLVKAQSKNADLINLGQVDGKNYFHELSIQRDWKAAGDYCKEAGLELATIETQAQADFLKSKFDQNVLSGYYWTAARDSHLPRQFTWNTTGTEAVRFSGLPWETSGYTGTLEYQTCVMFVAYNTAHLLLYRCDVVTPALLCQT